MYSTVVRSSASKFHFLQTLRTIHTKEPNRRVAVTGLGVISPVGCQAETAWTNIVNGKCGIGRLDDSSYAKLPCRIAGQIQRSELRIDGAFTKSELKTMAPATTLALLAADEAIKSSKIDTTDRELQLRTGVAIGMGMIDLVDVCETNRALETGYNRVSPFFVPRILPNMAAGQVSIKYGLQGPNHAVSTACATGVHAIGDSFRFIKYGDADVMVCGAAESCISPLAIAGFCRLRALSTSSNDKPDKASRPFDRNRDGFVMGEGAAILILEELEHAKRRNAPIYAEILGYGLSGDASHLTAPQEDGAGAFLAMQRAVTDAGINSTDVQYINAHATSTPIGDAIETRAIKRLFGEHAKRLAVSSTKGAHGHLLGSAGNLEAAFTVLACRDGTIPPTINLENVTDDMDLNFVPNESQLWTRNGRRISLKNSFGFGGTNASICIAEFIDS
ncbi:3-oxoacyl-[acyl-carrier-protein] synthase, mitochondrial [Bradysia coprophila]|uniref:3-oxoacyl-[acyl-carrier-protein] synthase, mitochondrial n=1 Tax=Bradysia coprophila TaxID=38358 RepID=UPI00187DC6FF|nr:3-oxoacyl-[acyl-carrier-protein] synthase, mitochondrial [Bradysia coprophila]XP_037039147.1 3-oxoacyl-[acyl-carrier-protein] synthase, mitochondrial [Bradysia coprophila]XP_037039148.1 3-oxoacyl-[acyl-carrier-protein] synthase, mitochondrial [Bradysia coprophila]